MYLSSVSFSWLLSLNRNNAGVSITFSKNRHSNILPVCSWLVPRCLYLDCTRRKREKRDGRKCEGWLEGGKLVSSLSSFPSPLALPLTTILPLIVSFRNSLAVRRGRQNACARQTWYGYYLHVLSWSSPVTNVFWSFTKRSVWRKVKFGENVFQTKSLSRLPHKVCCLLSSPVLLRKFTIINRRLRDDWGRDRVCSCSMAAAVVDENKFVSLLWELKSFYVQLLRIKNVRFCKPTRLWLQTRNLT